ncbi:hypothetical protein Aau02nite_04670 [Amorphoplanes auranticolor]|uniref:Uncharacterized protein n=1 Tax=Actinoplanes auranticolor TaxID=47988 RepID=A0A919S305_9ACTN|nr:hypothetical protein Aau02nite_04670 [Actinoplanes auranticolor]
MPVATDAAASCPLVGTACPVTETRSAGSLTPLQSEDHFNATPYRLNRMQGRATSLYLPQWAPGDIRSGMALAELGRIRTQVSTATNQARNSRS